MQIKSFERVSYKFNLLDTNSQPVSGLNVILQYFNSTTQVWQEIVRGTLNKGVFSFEEATSPASQLRSSFISDNTVPELRIVPVNPYYSFTKPQVLAMVCQVTPAATSVPTVLYFDFGTAYLVDKETLTGFDVFKDFILITSLVNQSANLALIKTLQSDLATAQATIVQLTSTNALLTNENKALYEKVNSIQADLTATKEINTQLTSANAQLTSTNAQLTNENKALYEKVNSIQADLTATKAINAELTRTNAELTKENEAYLLKFNELNQVLAAKTQTIAALNASLIAAQAAVENGDLEIARLNSIQVKLEESIADLERQIEELSRVINFDDRPIAVNTLYSNLIREIDTSAVNNTNANYKLTNISVKLKALISSDEDGMNAQLFGLTNTNLVNESTVSELTFDIAPAVAPPSQAGTLPNLIGLTETAVRRILDSLGLRLNPVNQNNPKIPQGDSFKQSPAFGTDINSNDVITVIFSKHE